MIIVIIIVVMLWCSMRRRDTSEQWIKDLTSRQKTAIHHVIDINANHSAKNAEVSYSQLLDEINLTRAYQELVNAYDDGEISASEFLRLTDPLTDRIDIRDILEV